ncbi:NAD(P)-binding protein [Vibrio sp. CAIM 722]|uniref:NAD(P)-binding protein n=1 Tax=Vibrio eleionomae TaxID=2653505 RepID=A0A7X4LK80_9VIBR|nr:FAD-dependent oxidoreductase [Vibrio eleionomae]MZI93495.1 NAD(P)-binding protein [Vibrio eleionomae]
MVCITLNGKPYQVKAELSLLQAAQNCGVMIPCLCGTEGIHGHCGLCDVEVSGQGVVPACELHPTEGMVVVTNSPQLEARRKHILESILANPDITCSLPPCQIACPAKVDVQLYLSLIAKNEFHKAVEIIKNTLPMPMSIGRVCPAFCEHGCLRNNVDQPLAIRQLKRYAADYDIATQDTYQPERKVLKDKRVAIVGAGPGGLSCGYFLAREGYNVDIFESMPKAGGWLRYGIPEFRLPKAVLDKEIDLLCRGGVTLHTNQSLGDDFTLSSLSADYDAVCLAVGASQASDMRYKGSNLKGCFLGVDFLKDNVMDRKLDVGKKVAVIGGGNTAMDCARTALRRGAEVTLIYRRTRDAMPAEPYEVDEAEHEGVTFQFLTNPVENIADENGRVTQVVLEKMQLGAPDASGRRRPEPTGETITEAFDTVIAAVSQQTDTRFLEGEDIHLNMSRWNTINVDEVNMFSGVGNIFGIGDFRRGPATAIEAIADARSAAQGIDEFLGGDMERLYTRSFRSRNVPRTQNLVRTDHVERLKESLKSIAQGNNPQVKEANYQRALQGIFRAKMPEIDMNRRLNTFDEVETGFTPIQVSDESQRCLSCGCKEGNNCKLRRYATDYDVQVS